MRSLKDPVHGVSRNSMMATAEMLMIVELFVDGILLFRVYSVFPLRTTRKAIWFGIFIPIFFLKVARLTNIIFLSMEFGQGIDQIPFQEIAGVAFTLPETKIAWSLQLVDNAYMLSLLYC
jgi:hypothetical protein